MARPQLKCSQRSLSFSSKFVSTPLAVVRSRRRAQTRSVITEESWCCLTVDPAHAHLLGGEAAADDVGVSAADPLQDVPLRHVRRAARARRARHLHVAHAPLTARYVRSLLHL